MGKCHEEIIKVGKRLECDWGWSGILASGQGRSPWWCDIWANIKESKN